MFANRELHRKYEYTCKACRFSHPKQTFPEYRYLAQTILFEQILSDLFCYNFISNSLPDIIKINRSSDTENIIIVSAKNLLNKLFTEQVVAFLTFILNSQKG